jgi:hypothetical protein
MHDTYKAKSSTTAKLLKTECDETDKSRFQTKIETHKPTGGLFGCSVV